MDVSFFQFFLQKKQFISHLQKSETSCYLFVKEKINGETDYIDSSIGVFEYKNAKISQQNGIVIINGTLIYKSSPENTTQNVTLTIPCYDSEHNEIGNAIAKTRISKKGDPTPFRATIKSDKVRFCALEYGTITGE